MYMYVLFIYYLLSMLHYKGVILHVSFHICVFRCRGCNDQHDQWIPFTVVIVTTLNPKVYNI
jgi:pyruvate-formate lyase-activating enzyme